MCIQLLPKCNYRLGIAIWLSVSVMAVSYTHLVAAYSAAELYEAIFARTRLYRQVQAWFDTADIVAMPTLSRPALPIDQDFFGPIEIDNQSVENIRAAWYPYTMPFNLTGNPAVSLPCGFDAAGMPCLLYTSRCV